MKTVCRNIFLAFCLAIYSFSVVHSAMLPAMNSNNSDRSYSQEIQRSELSKIIFPQTLEVDGSEFICIHYADSIGPLFDKFGLVNKTYCQRYSIQGIDYQRTASNRGLHFPPEDIIFPSHYFW